MAFSNKIVDLFGKIVDLLFERGVLLHLENPPGYGPVLSIRFISSTMHAAGSLGVYIVIYEGDISSNTALSP